MDKNRAIDRVESLANWLIDKRVIRSISAFERVCGLSVKYINNAKSSPSGGITVGVLARIYDTFPIFNLEWAVTGRGLMFTKEPDDATMWRIASKLIDKLAKSKDE